MHPMSKKDYQAEVKKIYDTMGYMSNTYIMRKYKINSREAHLLMKPLAVGCWLVLKHKGIISKIVRDSVL